MMTIEKLRSMDRPEMIAWKQALRSNVKTLEEIKAGSDRPADTVAALVKAIGSAAARQTVAALVIAKSSDGRISTRSRQWAAGIEDAPDPELARDMYIGSDRIHPAHLEQIAGHMAAWTDPEPDPDPAPADPVSEIAPDHITVDGMEIPVEWSVSPTGKTVTAFYHTEDGAPYRIRFTGSTCMDLFTVALAAARGQRTTAVDGSDLVEIYCTSEPVPVRKAATAPVDPDKQRHGDVPEKWFIGQALEGKSWKILFDGVTGKTRVIFQRKPSEKILQAVKAAGFYWSPSLKSWNKGLTFRAFRAAEKLHAELHALTA